MDAEELIDRIRKGDEKAFEQLFFRYYKGLCTYAVKIVDLPELAKDCVQDVFLKIWRNRENWIINYSLSVYLYRAVRNQALNKVEKRKTNRGYVQKYYKQGFYKKETIKESSSRQHEMIEQVWQIAESMPPRRRMVFELHRKHGLSYKEIAQVMNIARKTVENHMGKALQDLRDKMLYN